MTGEALAAVVIHLRMLATAQPKVSSELPQLTDGRGNGTRQMVVAEIQVHER